MIDRLVEQTGIQLRPFERRLAAHHDAGVPRGQVWVEGKTCRRHLERGGDRRQQPITFASGEPYTLVLLIRWINTSGTQGIFRSGSSSTGTWLWALSSGKLWGRLANVDSPASGSWHTMVRVWDGQQVRQYVDGLRTSTTATTATGSWTIYRWGWQFTGSEGLDEAYVPFFGAFGTAWEQDGPSQDGSLAGISITLAAAGEQPAILQACSG